jgi:hypothetical protein
MFEEDSAGAFIFFLLLSGVLLGVAGRGIGEAAGVVVKGSFFFLH